jgi:hypothetical protein
LKGSDGSGGGVSPPVTDFNSTVVNTQKLSSFVKKSFKVFIMVKIKKIVTIFFDLHLLIPNIGKRLPSFSEKIS